MKKPYLSGITKAFILFTAILFAQNVWAQAPHISYATPQVYTVGTAISPLSPTSNGGAVPAISYGQTTTFAGSAAHGSANGSGTGATFNSPQGIATDASGNIYVADAANNLVRKISPDGVVSTLAGSGASGFVDGTGTGASFEFPSSVAVDPSGNVFVADGNRVIRKITPEGVVSTFAGNGIRGANFGYPADVAADDFGDVIVADGTGSIIEIPQTGDAITLASGYNSPFGVTVDTYGYVYFTDFSNRVFKISNNGDGRVTVIAGNGTAGFANGAGTNAMFNNPNCIKVDALGNIYVGDTNNGMVRKITPAGVVSTLAGSGSNTFTDGIGTAAGLPGAYGIALDGNANLFTTTGNAIRKITLTGYGITPALPAGLSFNGTTGTISGTPTAVTPATYYVVTAYNLAGSSAAAVNITTNSSPNAPHISYASPQVYTVGTAISSLSPTNNGGAVPAVAYAQTTTFAGSGAQGSANGTGTAASFKGPQGIATDASGNIYVADGYNNLVRKITPGGVVSTLAGSGAAGAANGAGTGASFNFPASVAVDPSGNVYVADSQNGLIRKITPGGVVSTFAGGGVRGATLPFPADVAADVFGNVFIADGNTSIIEIPQTGDAITLASGYYGPFGVAVDTYGYVYFSDASNRIFKINNDGSGQVTVIAGNGTAGFANGTGTAAMFNNPNCLKVDALGNIYVGDTGNNMVREISPAGMVTTLAGSGGSTSANGIGTAADLLNTYGIALDGKGNMYVSTNDNLIRKVTLTGYGIARALPAGLNFNGKTGVISGTPTIITPATDYVVTAYNLAGNGATTVNITTKSIPAPNIKYTTPQPYTIGTAITALKPTNTGGAVPAAIYANTTTFAGSGAQGSANGTGTAASFWGPDGVCTDAAGNVYVAEAGNNLIRKITPAGVVTTLAGSGAPGSANGTGATASFSGPHGVAVDASGNVYVADSNNGLIRKITPAGVVTTLAGGIVNFQPIFLNPQYLVVDASGNVYVSDSNHHLIKKITPQGVVSTFAGSGAQGLVNGTGTAASFYYPEGLAIDFPGNIYVADNSNQAIRKITPAGVVSTIAGTGVIGSADGPAASATFQYPYGVAVDATGNVYVGDQANNLIRKISAAGIVSTLAGTFSNGFVNGVGTAASFYDPISVATDAAGNLFVADVNNNVIRKISLTGYSISPALPAGLSFDGKTGTVSGTPLAVTLATNYTVTAYNSGGSSSTVLNITTKNTPAPNIKYTTPQTYTSGTVITALKPTNSGGAVPETVYANTITFAGSGKEGAANKTGVLASFNSPRGVATDAAGNIYVADTYNNLIRKITPAGAVTTFAGSGAQGSANGTKTAASFYSPFGVAVDAAGNVYVADGGNNMIRKITPAGVVTTLAGSGATGANNGTGSQASFNLPQALVIDQAGNIYVADSYNALIRKITPAGLVSTFAGNGYGFINGTGTGASFGYPQGLAIDISGNIYVADETNQVIRKITPGGVVSTFAGSGTAGSTDGPVASATIQQPASVAVDAIGNVYVGDNAQLIRKISGGMVTTLAGTIDGGYADGVGRAAVFEEPYSLALDGAGNLFVADMGNSRIRAVSVTGYTISPALPAGLSFDAATGTISGKPTALSAATAYTITAYNGGGSSTTTVNIGVNSAAKIPLTITADNKTGIQGTTLPALTLTYTGFADGDTPASLATQPMVSTTAKSSSPQGYYPITVSGGSSDKYDLKYVQGTMTMVTQSFLAAPITGKVYGNADFYTFGTGTAGVTYSSSNTKIATVSSSGFIHITGAGTVTITFGNNNGHLTKTLTVGKAPLTITADNKTGIQGTTLPALTLTYTGFVNGDTPGGFTTQPTVSATAKSSSAQGYYPITVSGGSSANYTFSYVQGTLTMVTQSFLQAPLTKTYGNADFYSFGTATTGVTYSSGNTGVATVSSSGMVHIAGAGTAIITFGNSSGHLTKTLTVNKAALKVTADNLSKKAGAANPALTITYSGFVNGDTKTGLTTQPTAATTATVSSPAGSYPITVSGGVSSDYAFSYVAGTLTVTAAQGHDIDGPQVNAAVSPNGDGINDVLTIANIGKYPDNRLTVIDRGGARVFEVSGYDNLGRAFNGRSNINGKLQQAGTYFYRLQYSVDGVTKSKTGYIVLKY